MSYSVQNEKQWFTVEACPVCGNKEVACSRRLQLQAYRFADEIIPTPAQGIRLIECRRCGLLYKDVLPTPQFLAEMFTSQVGKIWADSYDFADEIRLMHRLTESSTFDVLDIGASNGSLLKALALNGVGNRRSALDVIMHPGLEHWIRGEFIRGLADNEDFSWSEQPYEVVTMFDVAEHLYNPDQTFANLRRFVKPGGVVVLETGNVDSFWPQKFGAHRWWYVCLFEHHIFWSRRSLEYLATQHGFYTLNIQRKRHKGRNTVSLRRNFALAVKTLLYRLAPDSYRSTAKALGKDELQPWSPFIRDHLRVVLQRG